MTTLPQLEADLFLTDGGLETTLIFLEGIDLPDFASFPLLDTDVGRAALRAYYVPYLDLASRIGRGMVLDTPTWRANADWGARLGYDATALADVNRRAVAFGDELRAAYPDVVSVTNGVIGPRGDGYVVGDTMSSEEAAAYHSPQVQAFADAGAAMASILTVNYVDEAIGAVEAANAADLPLVVSFTVETDGRLPSGQALAEAVEQVDASTGAAAAYFMINCAHPTHFVDVLDGGAWTQRVKAVRANSSTMSHEELDAAEELDRGDIDDLAARYRELRSLLPDLRVVGGCCGTDLAHISRIAETIVG